MQHKVKIYSTFAPSKHTVLATSIANVFSKKILFNSKDNTPPRLTTVAHLGGFSFNIGL
jgi:hypothetical protein